MVCTLDSCVQLGTQRITTFWPDTVIAWNAQRDCCCCLQLHGQSKLQRASKTTRQSTTSARANTHHAPSSLVSVRETLSSNGIERVSLLSSVSLPESIRFLETRCMLPAATALSARQTICYSRACAPCFKSTNSNGNGVNGGSTPMLLDRRVHDPEKVCSEGMLMN